MVVAINFSVWWWDGIWSYIEFFCREGTRRIPDSYSRKVYQSLLCPLSLTNIYLALRGSRLNYLPTPIIFLWKWPTVSREHHYFKGGSCIYGFYRRTYWKEGVSGIKGCVFEVLFLSSAMTSGVAKRSSISSFKED